ncbi:MAG TPA: hypothetical protein VF517_03785 [Thermoleophilaceae bacterium]|jgi:hypothetical protein
MEGSGSGISRRVLLERAGLAGAGALLAQVPGFLSAKGWLEEAQAQTADLSRDTLNGLVAFVVPGPDPYSVAQGQSTPEPGAIDAGATDQLIELLDRFVGVPAGTLPASRAVSEVLNGYAAQVNPAAAGGAFPSHFARLSFDHKVEVFRRFESETEGSALRFLSGILIGAVGFLAYNEGAVMDRGTRTLTSTPVGWTLSKYDGVAEGRPELRGYWKGRRKVRTHPRYRVKR